MSDKDKANQSAQNSDGSSSGEGLNTMTSDDVANFWMFRRVKKRQPRNRQELDDFVNEG